MLKHTVFILILFLILIVNCVGVFAGSLPGIKVFDKKLLSRIEAMKDSKNIDSTNIHKYTNRLFLETSPYLLQHAHNPVNWYPWGKEAFDTARKLNRPVFLSIGYSTCHWCHVMEEESFEDIEIAKFLNENYICIKVDREERPDIDSLYMKAVLVLRGSGGWPMTVILTPDKKPFFGGTYFPARDGDRGVEMGLLTILKKIVTVYKNDREKIENAGSQVIEQVVEMVQPKPGSKMVDKAVIKESISTYKAGFDEKNGGLRSRTKFPSSLPLELLFRYYYSFNDKEVLDMATKTLDKIKSGGIHDHVAGGFHRYTTDAIWLTPHYEKMLYDNALLSMAYTQAYQVTGNIEYKETAEKTLNYLLKEMLAPGHGFYSATDADSLTPSGEKEEGYFFTWKPGEIDTLFDKKTAKIIKNYFSIPDKKGERYILHLSRSKDQIASETGVTREKLDLIIQDAIKVLYKKRQQRALPGLDDKIITSWNSLVISALAKAGFAFDNKKYIKAAEKTASFIFENLFSGQELFRSFKDKKQGHSGFLNDYAFFAAACLDIFEATFEIEWLIKAIDINDTVLKKFEDKKDGGFFMTPLGQDDLITRAKPFDDGAVPSGNSIAIMNLVRLYQYTDKEYYRVKAEKSLSSFFDIISRTPDYMSGMLMSLDRLTSPSKQIIIVTPEGEKEKAVPFLNIIRKKYLPNSIVIVVPEGREFDIMSKRIQHIRGRKAINGKTSVYPCEDQVCKLPVTQPQDLSKTLE